jgi:uncharacterized protein with GYD domain
LEVIGLKAIILLSTNPGAEERAEEFLKRALASAPKGTTVEKGVHCFGRFDGAVICEFENLTNLSQLAEMLRREGTFHTETLIAID